jgi:hypothetical protein
VSEVEVKTKAESAGCDELSGGFERAGYLEINGRYVYTYLHRARNPIARVLLAGPFASERFSSHIPWIRWARFLASQNIDALRFDYGGVGESTGTFTEAGFHSWYEEVRVLADWLKAQRPELPLILHGLELGALMAGKAFAGGTGDALLLWSVPKSANDILRRALWRQMFMRFSGRSSFSEYIRGLETDHPLEVDGYVWSGRLWRESLEFGSLPELEAGEIGSARSLRVRAVKLEGTGGSVFTRGAMGRYVALNPDLTQLYAQNVVWIWRMLGKTRECSL